MDGDFTSNGIMTRTGAGTYSSITDNSANWDSAYGWGNHASAGYLTSSNWATPGTIGSTTPSTGVFTTVTGNTSLKLKDGDTNYATIKANNAMSADVTFTFPASAGTNGQFLKTDGSGNLSWTDQAASAVTSVNTLTGAVTLTTTNIGEGTNLYYTDARAKTAAVGDTIVDAVTDKAPSQNAVFDALALKAPTSRTISPGTGLSGGGDLSSDRTLSLANTTVTSGSYTKADITVDAQGRLTAAASGSIAAGDLPSSIDAAKIANGTVSNAEFQYLDGVTTAIQTQLDSKQSSITAGVATQYYRGDKTWQTLNSDAATEGATNLYFTAARAKSASVADSITNGVTDMAASENAVFDALALKSDATHNHTGVYEPIGLSANVVTTSKINDGAVTTAKLATCAEGKVLKIVGAVWACVYESISKSTTAKKCNGNVCLNAMTSLNH